MMSDEKALTDVEMVAADENIATAVANMTPALANMAAADEKMRMKSAEMMPYEPSLPQEDA